MCGRGVAVSEMSPLASLTTPKCFPLQCSLPQGERSTFPSPCPLSRIHCRSIMCPVVQRGAR